MFTGLTLGMGEIVKRNFNGIDVELVIEAAFDWDAPLEVGESIAVSGVCLTVTAVTSKRAFKAFASKETLSATTLGEFKKVNLERALKLSERLGGHLVSGHVDNIGWIKNIANDGKSLTYSFNFNPELVPFIIPKGSIAIDGVSLTINEVMETNFTVNLIPHTASLTTLGFKKAGDKVNLETDLIGKYVFKALNYQKEKASGGISLDFLKKSGYL